MSNNEFHQRRLSATPRGVGVMCNFFAQSAENATLKDVEGNEYIDFGGGIAVMNVGHSNPKVTEKIKQQVDRVQHTSTLFPTEALVALAEKVAQIAPGKLQKSFFTNSGTEANEVAVLTARMYTGNYEMLALRHGYSGHSQLAKSMTGLSTWRKAATAITNVTPAPIKKI